MKCYICERHLTKGDAEGFVCICQKCLELMEKSETRMVEKICEQRKELKCIHEAE